MPTFRYLNSRSGLHALFPLITTSLSTISKNLYKYSTYFVLTKGILIKFSFYFTVLMVTMYKTHRKNGSYTYR